MHVPLGEAEHEELTPAVLQQGRLIPLRELVVRRDALGPAHAHEQQLRRGLVHVLRRREEHGGRGRVEAAARRGRRRRRGRGRGCHRCEGTAVQDVGVERDVG